MVERPSRPRVPVETTLVTRAAASEPADGPLRPLGGRQGQRDRDDPGARALGVAVGVGDDPADPRLRDRRGALLLRRPRGVRQLVEAASSLNGRSSPATSTGRRGEPVRKRLAAGEPALLKIDLQGARQVRASDARGAVGLPGSAELGGAQAAPGRPGHRRRGDDPGSGWSTRSEELAAEPEFDMTIVNHTVEQAADELVGLLSPQPTHS